MRLISCSNETIIVLKGIHSLLPDLEEEIGFSKSYFPHFCFYVFPSSTNHGIFLYGILLHCLFPPSFCMLLVPDATKVLCPWDSPSKNSATGSHSLLQGSFPPRDQTQVSHIADRFFTIWATREAPCYTKLLSREAFSFTHPPAHMREPPSPSCSVFPLVCKFPFLLL